MQSGFRIIAEQQSDSGETIDGERREGETVWHVGAFTNGEMAREADRSKKESQKADHSNRVRNGGDHGEMLELGRCEYGPTRWMNCHREKAAKGTGNERHPGLTIVCHVMYCREKSGARGASFAHARRYRTKDTDMSGNETEVKTAGSKMDRRILRTRDTLGDALVELIREKPFEEITVQEILDRAGVGRSTFYTHYRDKDDLFLSDVEDFFEMASTALTRKGASPQRLAPVAELFSHIFDVREFYAALVASGKVNDVLALGRGFFARSIEERLRLAGVTMDSQSAAHAHALAGSLFALLDWWIDHGMKTEPKEMDALFHSMAWSGVPTSSGWVREARSQTQD
jgi:AcrR family transcriptional regulator